MSLPEDCIAVPASLVLDADRFGGARVRDCLVGVPVWSGGCLQSLARTEAPPSGMVLPQLIEAHCHLDKCHTVHRLPNVGGDLAAAITAQFQDKQNWTEDDIRTRAMRGLAEARAAGCGLIRSHVDWGTDAAPPLAWSVLAEFGADDLQCAALTGIDQMADGDFAAQVARQVAQSGGVLGAFVLEGRHSTVRDGLRQMVALADRYGLMLDFHVDEGLGATNGLELIADEVLATGFAGPVLCGHAVSLMDRTGSDLDRVLDKVARAGLFVCALPTTNLYLQSRTAGTPDRRGLTRLRELDTAGVPILIGSDNIMDAFCPVGAFDPMAALQLAVLSGHLDPPLDRWLGAVTINAARALGADAGYVDGAPAGALLRSGARTTEELVAGGHPLERIAT